MATYPLSFKAAVLEKQRSQLIIQTVEFRGPLTVGQVLVKLKYSGICGKQLEEIDGADGHDPHMPHLLGHEGTGEIIDVGQGVTKVKTGDMVVLHWRKGSGINSATPNYCRPNGEKINAGWITTFNEYAVVSENRITPISVNNDLMIGALLGCAVTTGVGVAVNQAQIKPYDTVVVYGCGGVGLAVIQGAILGHPRKIIAVDINDEALALAKQFGATDTINSQKENVPTRVKALTNNQGASKVLINTGHPKAIEDALETGSVPGACYFVGRPPRNVKIQVDALAVFQERNIAGSHGGDSIPDRDIPTYMALHNEGALHLKEMIAKVYPFDDINEAIQTTRGSTPGRCILKF